MIHRDTIIIGAGAAGMMCASQCGRRGRSVLLVDHARQTGSKIRISGGGHCNFTNLNAGPGHYLSSNAHFSKSALARFTTRDMLALVAQHRIPYYEKEAGQMFCLRSARDIVSLLERECLEAGVELRLNCSIKDVRRENAFIAVTDQGSFSSDSLVVATGGLSYAQIGATGFGHDVARRFGLRVTQVRPALVPFVFSAREYDLCRDLAGISINCTVSCGRRKFRGNILFTHRGLSGPAALQASLYWVPGMPIELDLLPEGDILSVFAARRRSRVQMHNILSGFLPRRFVLTWCGRFGVDGRIDQMPDRFLRETAQHLHAWRIIPARTEGFRTAEVTAGGVDTRDLSSKTMEARNVKGLYFIGEVVDVTGELGGYNLHWAWASGFAAGQYA